MMIKCPNCDHEFKLKFPGRKIPGYHGLYEKYVPMIKRMYDDGTPQTTIARELRSGDCPRMQSSHIRYILRRLGYPDLPRRPLLDRKTLDARNAEIYDLRKNKKTLFKNIATKYGISQPRCWQIYWKEQILRQRGE